MGHSKAEYDIFIFIDKIVILPLQKTLVFHLCHKKQGLDWKGLFDYGKKYIGTLA